MPGLVDEKLVDEGLIDGNDKLVDGNDKLVDEDSASSNSDPECNLNSDNLEISFEGLVEYEQTKKPKNPARKKKPKKKDRIKKWEEQLKRDLNNACIKGNVALLKSILEQIHLDPNEGEDKQITEEKALNFAIDEHGNTVLHVAALNNHDELIFWLLENNSSPCNKNDKQHTPYTINSDKSVRGVFREFAAKNPEKYNYSKVNIRNLIILTVLIKQCIYFFNYSNVESNSGCYNNSHRRANNRKEESPTKGETRPRKGEKERK